MNKIELKKKVVNDIDGVLKYLVDNIPDVSIFDDLLLLQARKSDIDKAINTNVLSQIEISI